MERVKLPRIVSWFSCGAASAVATLITLQSDPEARVAYCVTGSEHPDNARFLKDCERWFGKRIIRLTNERYASTWEVWEHQRYLSGIAGAPCTKFLKVMPRLEYQRPTDIHVFGYTADKSDSNRAQLLRDNYPELKIRAPLIDAQLTKANCLSIVKGAGIELPPLYALGFRNNNCIPCVKAQSPNYWALVRKEFPQEFERMVELSRRLNVRLARIDGERCFIDEVPSDQPTTDPVAPSCDFLCQAMTIDFVW